MTGEKEMPQLFPKVPKYLPKSKSKEGKVFSAQYAMFFF